MKSFSEEDNLIRLNFKIVAPLFISGKNLNVAIKPYKCCLVAQSFSRMLPPVKEEEINGHIEFSTNFLNFTSTAKSLKFKKL